MMLRARLMAVAALAAAAFFVLPGVALALEQKLVASDGTVREMFGASVAIDGATAVVGAPRDEGMGAVYVFTRTGNSWTETAKLTASDAAESDFFGDSVAIDGDTIVAGAPDDNVVGGFGFKQGSVHVFERTGNGWTQTAKLTASDGAPSDTLGSAVAIDGDTIVAGAPSDDIGENGSQGSAYTFARTGTAARTETAKLTASDGSAGDRFGDSVAIDGDTIVAGAPFDDVPPDVNPPSDQGSLYTFERTGAAVRTETARLASDGSAGDRLGSAVAIDGDTIVAGAPSDDIGENINAGSAYTFARTGGSRRTETARLTASDPAVSAQLGTSVAITGDTIIAGASSEGSGKGSASIFFPAASPPPPAAGNPPGTVNPPGSDPDPDPGPDPGPGPGPQPGPQPQPQPLVGPCGTPGGAGYLNPAKMRVSRARVLGEDRRLDVLAPITSRARGGEVGVEFQADNRRDTFKAEVTASNTELDEVRILEPITAGQAELGTGIVNLTYLGNEGTRPEFVRLRAASQRAELDVEEIGLIGDRLSAVGSVTSRAEGIVRLLYSYVDPDGSPQVHNARATIQADGDWKLEGDQVPAQLARCGGYLSIQFTGYFERRIRGEQLAYELNAGQTRRP